MPAGRTSPAEVQISTVVGNLPPEQGATNGRGVPPQTGRRPKIAPLPPRRIGAALLTVPANPKEAAEEPLRAPVKVKAHGKKAAAARPAVPVRPLPEDRVHLPVAACHEAEVLVVGEVVAAEDARCEA